MLHCLIGVAGKGYGQEVAVARLKIVDSSNTGKTTLSQNII